MITILANALVPIFAGLLLGYIAGVRNVVDNRNVKSLITFVMSFAVSCFLFVTVARTPHDLLWSQSKVAVALAIVYFVVFGLTHLAAQRLGKSTAADSTVLALTLGFPNATAVGLPLLLAAYGNDTAVSVAVAIAIWLHHNLADHSGDPRKQHGGGPSLISNDTYVDFSVESN